MCAQSHKRTITLMHTHSNKNPNHVSMIRYCERVKCTCCVFSCGCWAGRIAQNLIHIQCRCTASRPCECACELSNHWIHCIWTNTLHIRMVSHQCECACDASEHHLWCTLTGTHYNQMVSLQYGSACEPSNGYAGCKCMSTLHMQMASRQCECACEPSDSQLWCTCTHTYHMQMVARPCVSSHECHT